jgi:predicted peptidase
MKSKSIIALAGAIVLTACGISATSLAAGQTAATFEGSVTKKVKLEYLVYVPEAAAKEPNKKWPTILFLHGAGERGTNIWTVAAHGPPKIVKNNPNFEFIVISPQCPPNRWWETETLQGLIKDVQAKYPIDQDRFYLTGLSMGGYGSWALSASNPELFAAVAPICGGGNPADAPKLKNMPIWVFHGAKDPVVNIKQSEEMVKALKQAGNNVKFTVYPEAQHDSWTETYENPEFFKWLLEQKRKK